MTSIKHSDSGVRARNRLKNNEGRLEGQLIDLLNGPFARWHHATTTIRILQGIAFLCKLGILLFKPRWDFTKFKYERKDGNG